MIAVVVPVYNGAEVVALTVPAVLALAGVDEWVWVDDGSSDDTARQIERLLRGCPAARLVRLASNRGRSVARNAGIAATTAPVVVCLDADVEPAPGAALALAQAVRQPGAVAAVARLSPVLTRPEDPYQDYLAHHPRGPDPGHPPDAPLDWRFFVTTACGLQRDAFERAGRFREDVRYGEDAALGCALARRDPGGLRVASTVARLHGVGALDQALQNASEFGRALPSLRSVCVSGTAHRLARLQRWAHGARPAARAVRALVDRLPPGPVRRKAVRYLLALTILSARRG